MTDRDIQLNNAIISWRLNLPQPEQVFSPTDRTLTILQQHISEAQKSIAAIQKTIDMISLIAPNSIHEIHTAPKRPKFLAYFNIPTKTVKVWDDPLQEKYRHMTRYNIPLLLCTMLANSNPHTGSTSTTLNARNISYVSNPLTLQDLPAYLGWEWVNPLLHTLIKGE